LTCEPPRGDWTDIAHGEGLEGVNREKRRPMGGIASLIGRYSTAASTGEPAS